MIGRFAPHRIDIGVVVVYSLLVFGLGLLRPRAATKAGAQATVERDLERVDLERARFKLDRERFEYDKRTSTRNASAGTTGHHSDG